MIVRVIIYLSFILLATYYSLSFLTLLLYRFHVDKMSSAHVYLRRPKVHAYIVCNATPCLTSQYHNIVHTVYMVR